MALLNLEHSARAYYADLVFYGAASMGLSLWLAWALPTGQRLGAALLFALGVLIWTLLEYLLHRFVLHGFDPFRRWRQMHHDRPAARICSPTVISASAFGLLVLLPAWPGCPPGRACPWRRACSAGCSCTRWPTMPCTTTARSGPGPVATSCGTPATTCRASTTALA